MRAADANNSPGSADASVWVSRFQVIVFALLLSWVFEKMAEYKKFQELALYQAIEDLTLWLVHTYRKMAEVDTAYPGPGNHALPDECPTVGDNGLRRAAGSQIAASGKASADLDGLRMLLRISVSPSTSHQRFARISPLVGEVGNQIGGWLQAG